MSKPPFLPEDLIDRLVGLHEACMRVERTTSRFSFEDLARDELPQLALSKAVELVGETAAGIVRKRSDFARSQSDLSLVKAVGLRNHLVHGYGVISFERLWLTATTSILELRKRLEPILQDAGEDVP